MKSKYAAVEAKVQSVSKSDSGKRRYLLFGKEKKTGCIIITMSKAKDIDLNYLNSLKGKRISVTGKVMVESKSGRVGLGVTKKAQIKIIEK